LSPSDIDDEELDESEFEFDSEFEFVFEFEFESVLSFELEFEFPLELKLSLRFELEMPGIATYPNTASATTRITIRIKPRQPATPHPIAIFWFLFIVYLIRFDQGL